jgi:hypothetical protein
LSKKREANVTKSRVAEQVVHTIGGISLAVSGDGCLLTSPRVEHYDSFTVPLSSLNGFQHDIIARVVASSREISDKATPLFESDTDWKIQRNEDGYSLVFGQDMPGKRYMVIESDRLTRELTVYCTDYTLLDAYQWPVIFNPLCYPVDQLLLMNHLAMRGGLIVHAAGMVLADEAIVFPGISGAGKSTLARLSADASHRVQLLSDDRIIVRRVDDGFVAYGTPWPGDARVAVNASAELRGLFFLSRADENRIAELPPAQAIRRLFPVVSCPWYDQERLPNVLDTCERLVTSVPCFELKFCLGPEIIEMLQTFVEKRLRA